MKKIAILDDFQGVALEMGDWNSLERDFAITVFRDNIPMGRTLIERLRPFDMIVAMRERTPFDRDLLTALTNLRLLVTTGMWNRSIDMAAATELGKLVCGTATSVHAPVELTWALILALARRLVDEDAAMRSGRWQTGVGCELYGKTLGILGLGRLGEAVANIGRAFGMHIIAWSANLTRKKCVAAGVQLADKTEFFRSADFVSVHVVLSDRTRGLVSAKELALMKPTAFLVNTSRGPIVDETALIEALENGRIAGAAIDVYDREPPPADHPLRRAPRSLLTPHIGITTDQNYRLYYSQAVEDIRAFEAGHPVRVLNR